MEEETTQRVAHYADLVRGRPAEIPTPTETILDMVQVRYVRFLPSALAPYLEQCVAMALAPGTLVDQSSANLGMKLLSHMSTSRRSLDVLAHEVSRHPVTA
eukprot:62713-Pyramimonas_sp.AAC.1